MADEYVITHHLRERFVQRTDKRYTKLQELKEDEVTPELQHLQEEVKNLIKKDRPFIDEEIRNRLATAEDSRSILNNTGFMAWYHEKYGYDKRFQFLVNNDLLFVVVIDRGQKVVVTCVSSKTHLAGKAVLSKKKFRKQQSA